MAAMDAQTQQLMRRVPSVDAVLREPELETLAAEHGRKMVTDAVRDAMEEIRRQLLAQSMPDADEATILRQVVAAARRRIEFLIRPYYCRAVNATGIILHTGLGRALLSARAIEQVQSTLRGYSLLQVDRATGKRSRRDGQIEWLLQRLTGAEAATVVNNNAAATSIVLNTVAKGREVIVSRGQLVEIGGSFRLPDVMAFSGARLVEVGTTNKTHPHDYENAITENTAAILRVHPSNYKIQGFSSEVPLDTLVEIAHRHNLVMIDDVGRRGPGRFLAVRVRAGADAAGVDPPGGGHHHVERRQAHRLFAGRHHPGQEGPDREGPQESVRPDRPDRQAHDRGPGGDAQALPRRGRGDAGGPDAANAASQRRADSRAGRAAGRCASRQKHCCAGSHGRWIFADGQRLAARAEPRNDPGDDHAAEDQRRLAGQATCG